MLGRLSLRARLVLGVLVLAAVGLVAADVATYASLRSFLFDRTDSTLDAEHHGSRTRRPRAPRSRSDDFGAAASPSRPVVYVQVRTLDRHRSLATSARRARFRARRRRRRRGCRRRSRCRRADRRPRPGAIARRYFTVPATSGGDRYRVRASIEPRHATSC